jgi:hypothetical protein
MRKNDVLEQLGWTNSPHVRGPFDDWYDERGKYIGTFGHDVDLKDMRKYFLENMDRNYRLLTKLEFALDGGDNLDGAAGFITF